MASQMGNYNPHKQSYFTRTGEGVHFVPIFFADSMTPKKLHRKNCTEFVSHVLETLEDERLEPTAMTHLERKIIKTKPPGNYVPCVNLQGCKGLGDCMATAFLAKTRRGSQNSVEYPGLGTKICGFKMLEKKWPEVFVGTMLAPSKTSLKNNHTESILTLNISMIFAMVKSPRCYLQIGWHVIPGCRVRSKFKDRLPRSGRSVSFQLENNPVGVRVGLENP